MEGKGHTEEHIVVDWRNDNRILQKCCKMVVWIAWVTQNNANETGGVMLLLSRHCFYYCFCKLTVLHWTSWGKDWRVGVCQRAGVRWEWINNIPTYSVPSFCHVKPFLLFLPMLFLFAAVVLVSSWPWPRYDRSIAQCARNRGQKTQEC